MHVISLTQPRSRSVEQRVLWRGQKGFRLFFLLAALFASLAVPVWLLALGGSTSPGGAGGPRAWHGHEMIFGYAVAVIAGFLLTAVEKWTGRVTANEHTLFALGFLWLCGRAAWLWAGHLPPRVVVAADVAFLPALTWVIARPIAAARNRRNYGVVGMLVFLSLANGVTHLETLGVVSGVRSAVNQLALDVVTLMMLLIGARIIPSFTHNATGARVTHAPRLSTAALALVGALGLSTLLGAPSALLGLLSFAAAGAAALAARRWGTLHTLRHPMLWILHAGYFWIVVSLALRGLEAAGVISSPNASLHALTVGGLGALTLGMMSRVTLGHTGRVITSTPLTTASFVLITVAALCRVVVPELVPTWTLPSWHAAGTLWCLAFVAYLVRFAPQLVQPRVDGQPG